MYVRGRKTLAEVRVTTLTELNRGNSVTVEDLMLPLVALKIALRRHSVTLQHTIFTSSRCVKFETHCVLRQTEERRWRVENYPGKLANVETVTLGCASLLSIAYDEPRAWPIDSVSDVLVSHKYSLSRLRYLFHTSTLLTLIITSYNSFINVYSH